MTSLAKSHDPPGGCGSNTPEFFARKSGVLIALNPMTLSYSVGLGALGLDFGVSGTLGFSFVVGRRADGLGSSFRRVQGLGSRVQGL